MPEKDTEKNAKLPLWLKVLAFLSIMIAIIVCGAYVWRFGLGQELSNKQEIWGQFGDYIGGTLNPLFALTALLALLYTIVLQSTELRSSAEQLKKSAEALQSQNAVLERQNFEATFFQLIRLYNDILAELHIIPEMSEGFRSTNPEKVKHEDRQCIEALYQILSDRYLHKVIRGDLPGEEIDAIDNVYKEFYSKYGNLIGHYFRTIYNILKFIENSRIEPEQKTIYTNLLRAQLSKFELGLLLYNCISSYGRQKMLPLVRKYHILKHVELDVLASSEHLQLMDGF